MSPKKSSLLLLYGVLLCAGCAGPEPTARADGATSVVRVASAERAPFDEQITLAATVEAWQVATLVPDVPGRVRSVEVRIGQQVDKGDVLLTLVDDDYAQAVLQAEAALDMARAQHADAEATHRRFVELRERDAVTAAEFEKVVVGLDLAGAQLRQAEVGVRVAKDRLADTRLRAPFAGVVVARNVDPGETLGGMAQLPPIQLADLSRVRVVASVSELRAPEVEIGDPASVRIDSLEGERFEGTVAAVNRSIDPRTRSVAIEVTLAEPDARLLHGMTAELSLAGGGGEHLAVPREALLERDDGVARVLVVTDGKTASRQVQYGRSGTALVPVLSGLDEGDQVVVAGHARLPDGERVEVVDGGSR
ncbi:efflux RND transporter periplasmic adaptor subunit [Myxococcota bacterium]|nr:efflux RND transporter periplasmic adaptor subunit [Myxococcota bacterium]